MELEVRLPQLDHIIAKMDAIESKLDALTLAAAAPGVAQIVGPAIATPKPVIRPRRRVTPPQPEPARVNGEDSDQEEEEATLRARAAFEAKRTTRLLGLAATRAVLRKATGQNILQVDDVPVAQLPALIAELQAM